MKQECGVQCVKHDKVYFFSPLDLSKIYFLFSVFWSLQETTPKLNLIPAQVEFIPPTGEPTTPNIGYVKTTEGKLYTSIHRYGQYSHVIIMW